MVTDDLPALRAAAGDIRNARNLRQISSLCEAAPERVAGHAGRLAYMERVLTSAGSDGTPFVDWLDAWAQAHMTLHPAVERVEIDGSHGVVLADRTAGMLQLLDAALVAAADTAAASSVDVAVILQRIGGGVSVRMDCDGTHLDRDAADAVVAMATSAGLPAAWRIGGGRASIAVLVDVEGAVVVSGRA